MGNRVLNMLVLTLAAFYFLGISQVSSHAPGNTGTFLYWFDAYLASTSDKCGQQKPISGWTVTSQRCDANGDTARPCPGTDAFQAGSGIFTVSCARCLSLLCTIQMQARRLLRLYSHPEWKCCLPSIRNKKYRCQFKWMVKSQCMLDNKCTGWCDHVD